MEAWRSRFSVITDLKSDFCNVLSTVSSPLCAAVPDGGCRACAAHRGGGCRAQHAAAATAIRRRGRGSSASHGQVPVWHAGAGRSRGRLHAKGWSRSGAVRNGSSHASPGPAAVEFATVVRVRAVGRPLPGSYGYDGVLVCRMWMWSSVLPRSASNAGKLAAGGHKTRCMLGASSFTSASSTGR